MRLILRTALSISLTIAIAPASALAQAFADRIFVGGPVLTMVDQAMEAQAVATRDGRILAVGDEGAVLTHRGSSTEIVDLAGRALIPGFVDSHGHVVMGGLQALSANLLAPPDGNVKDIAGLQEILRRWAQTNSTAIEAAGLIIGFGYDQAQLAELRHPTRIDLDAVSSEIPIYIVHQSGHFGAANTAALALAGIAADTPDPTGGVIRRDDDGAPNGVLEETAHFNALVALLGGLGQEGFAAFARAGAEFWARFGYTTAQEGRSLPGTVEVMRSVAQAGGFSIDVVTYPDVLVDRDFIIRHASREYVDRLRVGGAKLTIDGSPQGFTAWRDRPYFSPIGSYPPGYAGYAAVRSEAVIDAIDWAFQNDIQILTHANGEAASDLLIAAIETAQAKHGVLDLRPVLIHGQFLREDQVAAYDRLGVFPSLFPMHTFYWGDWHREHTVGPERADDISPTGWVLARGMRFGSHHDAPVAFPDSMRVLDATVTRRSRSGDILGPTHRVDVITALKAITLWPAWQHHEDHHKGSIEVGKLADLVILSDDPTAVDPETLDQLRVVETIKEGKTVFSASAQPDEQGRMLHGPSFAHVLLGIAREAEFRALPDARQTERARAWLTALPHNPACAPAAMLEIYARMLETGSRGWQHSSGAL